MQFIVRSETGALARDEYRMAILYDPSKSWEPWASGRVEPQAGHQPRGELQHQLPAGLGP